MFIATSAISAASLSKHSSAHSPEQLQSVNVCLLFCGTVAFSAGKLVLIGVLTMTCNQSDSAVGETLSVSTEW